MDHYERLGVSRECDREALHKAFRQLSKLKHPDRFGGDLRAKAEKEYLEIVKAFNTLKDPKQRQRYDRQLKFYEQTSPLQNPAEEARTKYQEGMQFYQRGKYEEAFESFQAAHRIFENPEYFFYCGLALRKKGTAREDAIKFFQKAISLNPKQAKYHQFLIQTLVDLNMVNQAGKAVERALKLFPESKELKAYAAAVDPEKYKDGQGLLDRMFNRRKGT